MGFEGLGEAIVHTILSKLDAEDKARVACVDSLCRIYASSDDLWSFHCSEELRISAPVDPFGNRLPSFRVTYQVWRNSFSMYPWLLVKRVCKCWDKLKNWLRENYPEVADTLRRGVTEEELNDFENSMGVRLPIPSRVLYRVCDGQKLQKDRLWGLIGGYSFHYYYLVNVYLLSLSEVQRWTERKRCKKGLALPSEHLVVAQSAFNDKIFFLNCKSGELSVGTTKFREAGEMMPCVPSTLINLIHRPDNNEVQRPDDNKVKDGADGLLLWLEEHGRRLENGTIGVHGDGNFRRWMKDRDRHLKKDRVNEDGRSKSISQFPGRPPMRSTSVAFGVQVHAFGVLIPEMSNLQDCERRNIFAYSIRMSLLPEGCTAHGMRYNSCQLEWRHWVTRDNDTVVNDVRTAAVMGKYPLLAAGEEEFVHESITALESVPGSIEGSFKFVPGRLSEPKGDLFDVEVRCFPLELPEYIF